MKRKWQTDNDQLNQKCIDEVITRIDEIEDSVGVIAAQEIIDIVLENLAPEIYNKGVADAKKAIDTKVEDLNFELDSLKQHWQKPTNCT